MPRKYVINPGDTYNRLTVIRSVMKGTRTFWECSCECGEKTVARGADLAKNLKRSCGCLQREIARKLADGKSRNRYRVGETFGDLTILKHVRTKGKPFWRCLCSCGTVKLFTPLNLYQGAKSCGCKIKGSAYQHGKWGTPEHRSYTSMISRCFYEGNIGWDDYGGRGITVCRRWRRKKEGRGFIAFLQKMGPRPSLLYSLDRIDNDGNYSCGDCSECMAKGWPFNCRWADRKTQASNRRKPRKRGTKRVSRPRSEG